MITRRPIRWGILSTGHIAHAMARAVKSLPEAQLLAVASRTRENAAKFADTFHIPRHYPSCEQLLADDEIDLVYIGTPHGFHYENMLSCLKAGKHVLCEKAFTLNAAQAAECIALARRNGLFLMEAMWMRYLPAMQQVREWITAGVIGEVRRLQADFCIHVPFDPGHRLFDPHLGGGALLDLGIYPISLASFLLGLPERMYSHATIGSTGVDETDTITFIYADGRTALLSCSSRFFKPSEAFVLGTKGYIKIHQRFFRPDRLTLHLHDGEPAMHDFSIKGNGYEFEAQEVNACIAGGRLESDIMPLDETLALMQLMDELRREWGVVYPRERA